LDEDTRLHPAIPFSLDFPSAAWPMLT